MLTKLITRASTDSDAAGTFALGYLDGGPIMVWSNWILTAGMNLAVAMCLAEISSAMPVAGGPYYW